MGVSQSSVDIIKKIVNDVSVDVLAKNSSSASSSVNQTNDLTIVTTGSTITGSTQSNVNKLDINIISKMVMTGDLQSQLTTAISDKLSQDQNVIGLGLSNTGISTIVNNSVNTSFNVANMSSVTAAINQKNTATIIITDSVITELIKQQNTNDSILKVVADMSTQIAQQLVASSETSTDVKISQTNPISAFLSSPAFIVIVLVLFVLAIVGGILYYMKETGKSLW